MFVAPYPQWISTLEMKDGRRFYFDGPKDLFIYFFGLQKYSPGSKYEDVVGLFVTEYYTTQTVSANDVFFVTGSDVRGPMGMEMVPVAGREAADTFRRDHGGTGLMRFDGRELLDVSAEEVDLLGTVERRKDDVAPRVVARGDEERAPHEAQEEAQEATHRGSSDTGCGKPTRPRS